MSIAPRHERTTTAPTLEVPAAELTVEQQRELYRLLAAVRHLDVSAIAWQRQGIIPGYAPGRGQEAAQVGSAFALERGSDFVFPTYREVGVARAWGVDMVAYMSTHKATWHGGLYDPAASRFAPIQAVVGGSVLHAVGWAHGQTLDGRKADGTLNVAISYCGDGASSQGDVHEAMNFAAIFKAPVIFFVQNNKYAISVPLAQQSVAPSLAHKAVGYGMAGEHVDGNDVVALLAVLKRAVALAKAGSGPLLVEANTYRIQSHTNADDATRYRQDSEVAEWLAKDPLTRMQAFLRSEGLLDDDADAEIAARAEAIATRLRDGMNAEPEVDPQDLFRFLYTEPNPQLDEQSAQLAEELRREGSAS